MLVRACRREKKQLIQRLPPEFVRSILDDFNNGTLDATSAAARLGVGRTRLYELRTSWLKDKSVYQPGASGGDRGEVWPPEIIEFLKSFLPLQDPPNFQLVVDEMDRLHGFKRARSTVESYVKAHFSQLIPQPERKPRTYRRFRRAHVVELWQHDSSIHQWWPAAEKQTLLLTVDDCSGLCVAGRFVERDTTWNHFLHFREAFKRHGLPQARCQPRSGKSRSSNAPPNSVTSSSSTASTTRSRSHPANRSPSFSTHSASFGFSNIHQS